MIGFRVTRLTVYIFYGRLFFSFNSFAPQTTVSKWNRLHQLPASEVPCLENVLPTPRPRQNLVPDDIHRVAADVRSVEASHRRTHSEIPYLNSVVPSTADENVLTSRFEFKGKDAI